MCINVILIFVASLTPISTKVFDAGRVKEGKPILHTFKLLNQGKDSIYITEIRRTCGCTTFENSKRILAPGDTFSLSVKVNTDGFMGPITKSVFVFYKTQRGKRGHIKLKVKADIFKNSELPQVVFYKIRKGIVFDIRDAESYNKCHIAGSENIQKEKLLSLIKSGYLFIEKEDNIFILAPDSTSGEKLIKELHKWGYKHSYYIEGGINKWIKDVGKKGLICLD